MNLEDRLRRHFQGAARRLPEPPGRLEEVVRAARRRRAVQRGAALAAAAAIVIAVPLVIGALSESTVELEPLAPAETDVATPPPTPSPSPSPSPDPSPQPSPEVSPEPSPEPTGDAVTPGDAPPLDAGDLRATVLAYGPADHDSLLLVEREGEEELWSGPVDVAFPDGQGGVLLQPATEASVLWLPDGDEAGAVRLAEADEGLLLRGLLPDGRALYSLRPPDEETTEGDREEFFAVALSEGAQPEPVGDRGAFESWHVGPVTVAGGETIHAGCHLHCSLWPGLADAPAEAEPLYQGLSIEGLDATPDGRVLAFVEFDVAQPDLVPPTLVLLDGASFEVLSRIDLPLEDDVHPGTPQVSLSADGQRVLVALGTGTPLEAPVSVPEAPYLVEGALTESPEIRAVETSGVLRWFDPVEASGEGGPVSADERATAEALMGFAREPGPETLAELPLAGTVGLGLGDELFGEFAASELADAGIWSHEPEDNLFRGRVGPFSALDVLGDAGDVDVRGGPHRHCASPPVPPPAEVAGARRVSIQPTGIDSCIMWWSVDLFLTGEGEVAAVTLDLYDP